MRYETETPLLASLAIYPTVTARRECYQAGLTQPKLQSLRCWRGMGVSVPQEAIAAIGMRLATLWFAIFLGLFALVWGELEVVDRA